MINPRTRLSLAILAAVTVLSTASPAAFAAGRGRGAQDALRRARLLRADVNAASVQAAAAAGLFEKRRPRRLKVAPGDLLSATPRRDAAVRVQVGPPVKSKRATLNEIFVPRGSDYDPVTGVLAIAAVSRVLLFEVATGALGVLESPGEGLSFSFVNDVLFDGDGALIIADRGAVVSGPEPLDGVVWRYEFATLSYTQIATKRALANPKLLAIDRDGAVHIIDGEGGPQITPFFDDHWDALYVLTGNQQLNVAPVWDDEGIQATAYDIDRSGRHWIANVAELVTLRGGRFERPCVLPYPFAFLTGLVALDGDAVMVIDGHRATGGPKRLLYQVDRSCAATLLGSPARLKDAYGLARVPDDS